MTGALFRASLTSIRAATAEIHVTQKFKRNADGQTAFQLYIVEWVFIQRLVSLQNAKPAFWHWQVKGSSAIDTYTRSLTV